LNRKVIIGVCGAMAIALFSTIYVYNTNLASKSSGNSEVNYSEVYYSRDELIKNSDLVVRCVYSGENETKRVSAKTTNSEGKEVIVKGTVTTYKMKPVEKLKGSVNNEFEIGLMGSENKNLEKGSEYVLFLNKNDTDKYKLTSYGQGLNKVKHKNSDSENNKTKSDTLIQSDSSDESIEIESVETKEVINYKALKEKIKELDN
jgi:hypothetical protein